MRLRKAKGDLTEIEWDHEVLFQKLQALESDHDGWKKKARHTIHAARQRANFQNLLLERKLSKLSMTGDQKTAAMAEILRKANIDLESLDESSGVRVTDVIGEKNGQVELLQQRLKQIKDAHAAMIQRYEALMDEVTQKPNTIDDDC